MALRPGASSATAPARPPSRRRRLAAVALTLPALLVATSCSLLNGSSGGSSGTTGPNPQGLEKTTINVAAMTVVDCAPFYLAEKNGYFAQEGLNVHVIPVPTGAVGVPDVENGKADITVSNWATVLEAQAEHAADKVGGLKAVSDASSGQQGTMSVDVLPSSGITTPAGLIGKTVSVNAFSDLPYLALRDILAADNVDYTKVHFTIVAHPATPQALASGQVDAAVQLEPFKTKTERASGARPLIDLFGPGPTSGLSIAGWVTSGNFVKQNPKTVAAFARAMQRGAEDAQNRATVEQITPTFATGIDKDTAALMNLPTFPTSLNVQRLQRVADLMVQYKLLPGHLDVSSMIVPSPSP